MTKEYVDLKIDDTTFDISIGSNGDYELVDSLDTSLITTFYTNQRADTSEIPIPQNQNGWWGNLFPISPNFQIGSKIWLLNQAVNDQLALNNAIDYARKAYQWLLTFNYADNVSVTGARTLDSLTITVIITKNTEVVTQKVFDLWRNTLESVNG